MATGELTEKMASQTTAIKDIINTYGLVALQGKDNELDRMVLLAEGMSALQNAITPEMMDKIMAMQGTKLGFRTDKDNASGYQAGIVKDVTIEALLRGANMTGNEVNIIAGNCYLTKEFFQRAVRQLPGITDVEVELAVPAKVSDTTSLVSGWVKYKRDGKEEIYARTKESDARDLRLSIRVNAGMTPDAVLGKAERKLLAAVYAKLTGISVPEGDTDDHPNTVTGQFDKKQKTAADVNADLKGARKRSEAEQFELDQQKRGTAPY